MKITVFPINNSQFLVHSAKFVKMVDDRLSVRLFDANDGSDVNQKLGIPLLGEVCNSYTESPRNVA